MNYFQNQPVQKKVLLLMGLASLLALVCVIAAAVIYEATTFRPRMLRQLSAQLAVLNEVMRAPLEFEDNASADRFLESQKVWPMVKAAAVYDRDDKLFALYRRSSDDFDALPAKAPEPGHRFLLRDVMASEKIVRGNQRIGSIALLVELPPLWARLPQYGIMFGAVGLAILIVGGVLIVGGRRHFLAPLSNLVQSAAQVARNNDYSVRVDLKQNDELGELAERFNTMLAAIQRQNEDLARELSERRRAEAELRKKDERFQRMTEYASDSIAIIDDHGVIRYQSPSIVRLLGYTAEEMTGRNAFEMIHPDDQPHTRAGLALAEARPDEPTSSEYRIAHKDGTWRQFASIGKRMGGEERLYVVSSRDITDSRRMELQLRQAQKMEAIGQLSGGVAHDFNNLLTVIKGHVSLLQETAFNQAEFEQSLTDITDAVNRASNLTRQLLAFGRRQTLQLHTVNLNEIVAGMAKMLRRILGEDVEFVLKGDSGPLFVSADAGMMEQVLLNLVVNARDAMPAGGRLAIDIAVAIFDEQSCKTDPQARPGRFVRVSVADNGTGIDASLMPKIFEPFFTTKEFGKGTGLGLATVYGIVQQHRGWINVRSEVGRGSTFSVYLPNAISSGAPAQQEQDPKAELVGGTETILVVEDDVPVRNMLVSALKRHGYSVIEAESGVEALKLWPEKRGQIDIVLTDLVMPGGVSGVDLMHRLKADNPRLRVICSSGYSPEIAGKDFPLEEGVNFIPKPYELSLLLRTLRNALDRPEA